jgi:hypothetical protein
MSSEPNPTIDARRLLAELDTPHAVGRREQVVEAFADALDALIALIQKAGGATKGGGELAFAINYLLARSISDLAAGIHLGTHVYLQQAHSVARPVLESIDLIDLFAEEPMLAERWVNAEKPGKEFSPRQVREKLGRTPEDAEVYGHFSEVGPHPRFAGANLAGGMIPGEGDEPGTALIRIGPYFPDHPRSLHIYLWSLHTLGALAFRARHLELISDSVSAEDWRQRYREVIKALSTGCKELRAEFVAMDAGEGTEYLETMYDELLAKVEAGEVTPPSECPDQD